MKQIKALIEVIRNYGSVRLTLNVKTCCVITVSETDCIPALYFNGYLLYLLG